MVEDFEFDIKGNLINYWDKLAQRDGNDVLLFRDTDDHKATYTYEPIYNLLTEKSYKRDVANAIKQMNTMSADGKSIGTSQIYENNNFKEQTKFVYDSYGNISQKQSYLADINWTTYISENYSYTDNLAPRYNGGNFNGAFLTKKWTEGVVDADGTLVALKSGGTTGAIEEIMTYDFYGNMKSVQDGVGNTTTMQYDTLGRLTRADHPDGTYITRAYVSDASENSVSETDERGHTIKKIYDQVGMLVYTKDMTSNATLGQIVYDEVSQVLEEYDAMGNKTTSNYLSDGRVLNKSTNSSSGGLLSFETYTYDEAYNNGELFKTTKTAFGAPAPAVITNTYTDKSGNVTKVEQVHGSEIYTTTYKYDYQGNKTEEKSARANNQAWSAGYTTKVDYDYAGRVIKTYNIDGDYTSSEYDALGRVVKTADIKGNKASTPYYTTYQYDALARLIKKLTPFENLTGTIAYTTEKYYYDRNGNIINQKLSNNKSGQTETFKQTGYNYNSKNLLTVVVTYDDNAVENFTQYYYDAVGNMLRMYTGLNDLLTISGLDSVTLGSDTTYSVTKYSYDQLGRQTSKTDPLGQVESYTSYDANNNLLQKTDRNGNITTYTYDGLNRILTQNVITPSGVGNTSLTYTYNLLGSVATENDGIHTKTYTYDDLGRCTKEVSGTQTKNYTYDANGNRLSLQVLDGVSVITNTSYTYDTLDRLQTVTENGTLKATYTYDANGNRQTLAYSNGNTVQYNYNLANQPIEIINKQGAAELSKFQYLYNLDGNKSKESDIISGKTTDYVYDDLGRLETETDKLNGTLVQQLVYTYDDANNRATQVASGTKSYSSQFNYDVNNRLMSQVKTEGTGTETTSYSYDPNGNTITNITETLKPTTGTAKTYIYQTGQS